MPENNLNLPKTAFSMKANLPSKEPKILEFWEKEKLYEYGSEGLRLKDNLAWSSELKFQLNLKTLGDNYPGCGRGLNLFQE